MNNTLGDDGSFVFILRLWRESSKYTEATPEWRAIIENVSTGSRYPIKDMTALQSLLSFFEGDIEL